MLMTGQSISCWFEFSGSNRGLCLLSNKLWTTCGSVKVHSEFFMLGLGCMC
ncbi:hypothetical protein LINPERHAP2_LOCUS24699 [Linum perenne]